MKEDKGLAGNQDNPKKGENLHAYVLLLCKKDLIVAESVAEQHTVVSAAEEQDTHETRITRPQ